MDNQVKIVLMVKLFFALATVVALAVVVVRPVVKSLRAHAQQPDWTPQTENFLEAEELEIPSSGLDTKKDRQQLLVEVRQNPQMAAQLVSRWMREKKG